MAMSSAVGPSASGGTSWKIAGRGVGSCTAEESELRPATAILKKAKQQSQAKQEQGAQRRQLDTETASSSSTG